MAALPPRIGFKRHLRVETARNGDSYAFSERGVTVMGGRQVAPAVALLDGTRDLHGVFDAMPPGGGAATEEVAGLVLRLSDEGLLALGGELADRSPEAAYWDAAGVAGNVPATRRIAVRALGGTDRDGAVEALRHSGFEVVDAGEVDAGEAALTLLLCEDYLDPVLAAVDAAHRARRTPWLPVKTGGTSIWIGPVFPSDGPGCWHCLSVRLWRHRRAESCAQSALGRTGPAPLPPCGLPALADAAVRLAAVTAAQWLAGHRHDGTRAVWTFDSLTFRSEHHELRPYPQCGTCGDPDLVRARTRRPVRLAPTPKAGGGRAMTAGAVRERFGHLVSPVTGVVKRVERDPRGPEFFNCFRSGANAAAAITDVDHLRSVLQAQNGGKGVTPLHAEVGALCEAVERHSALFHGDEERVRGSLRSLGDRALHPNEILLHDPRQFADRRRWNAAHSPFQHVTEPFDPDLRLDWTPVWSLTREEHRLLPTAMLYFDAPGPASVRADSNGNAAGASVEDAVLQGLCELVERDAVALWWYNRLRVPEVDLDAFADPWVDELRRVHARLGRRVWVLDVTSDLSVPVLVALSCLVDGPGGHVVLGFGAHLDARAALHRALAELNQMMPAALSAEGGATVEGDPDACAWWRSATTSNQPYLLPDPDAPARGPAAYPPAPEQDLLADVTLVRRRVEAAGAEVLVLDQTRPDVGMPAVKVLAPGLRHFWARFAPGRLFDVPVRLGRLREPTPYDRLNPLPMFL
ncbi:TOMM precursor leader peptide-binding protein [Saccharothrix lopnurensis]|uniref:TOMM leader peptide-binding protein n=1 Tax=Saccharothrix lopnurensis TaxID=1670621 RepID=A0ABW1PGY4_9PSEU